MRRTATRSALFPLASFVLLAGCGGMGSGDGSILLPEHGASVTVTQQGGIRFEIEPGRLRVAPKGECGSHPGCGHLHLVVYEAEPSGLFGTSSIPCVPEGQTATLETGELHGFVTLAHCARQTGDFLLSVHSHDDDDESIPVESGGFAKTQPFRVE